MTYSPRIAALSASALAGARAWWWTRTTLIPD